MLECTIEYKNTKYVKGCLGLEITPSIERHGKTFYPKPTRIYETIHTYSGGLQFKRFNGEEIVYFENFTIKRIFCTQCRFFIVNQYK